MRQFAYSLLVGTLAAAPVFGEAHADGDKFMAIAFSKSNGAYGFWHKASSRERAEEGALQQCGPGCEVVVWARNACAALAVGKGHGFGTYWSANENKVEDGSVAECEKRTSDCEFKVMTCAGY